MVTRPELIEIMKELSIEEDSKNLSHEEKVELVKKTVDKRFHKRYNIGVKNISTTLRKFMTLEYNYKIEDKEGNELDYNLKKKEDNNV